MTDYTIFAHRGMPAKWPENTMAGFEAIAKTDVQWLETDVAITNDGKLILIHDDFLDRTTDMAGEITALNWADIQKADAGVKYGKKFIGETIPTMDEFVPFLNKNSLNINFELKGVSGPNGLALSKQLIEKMIPYLNQLDENIEVQISSFNPILLDMMHQAYPDATYGLLFGKKLPRDWPMRAQVCKVTAINIDDQGLTQDKVESILNQGYKVNVWTVNSGKRVKELFSWGVTGIFTDNAPEMLKYVPN